MDALIELVAQNVAAALVGAAMLALPVFVGLGLKAAKAAAAKTPNKTDDRIVEALADEINRKRPGAHREKGE